MTARAGLAVAALLAACTPEPGTASGRVVDARTGTALGGIELVLTGGACPSVTVTTDTDGRWSAAGLCGEERWTVAPSDPDWFLGDPAKAAPDMELRLWRAPSEPGVYTVAGTTITPLLTHTVLDTVRIFDTTEEVRFPVEIPGALPTIGGETVLLVVGGVVPLGFEPLVASEERRWFGTKETPQPIDPWVYLGVRFSSDTAYERVKASLDASKVTTADGERLRYVAGGALPPGRYALPTADGARAFLLAFE